MGRKKHPACAEVDDARLTSEMRSPDDAVRGDAVRSLCPCHVGWEAFEEHVADVLGALRDSSRGVRAQALHVFEDAARMRHLDEVEYHLQAAEQKMRRKRASRFRPEENRLETTHREKLGRLGRRLGRRLR